MLGKPSVILLVSVGMLVPTFIFADSSSIDRLVFTTESRTALPGETSDVITVQTQNGNGEAEDVSETNDVIFSSTSGTGEFLSSSGNPVSGTMAKNTASRNFYYRDSSPGSHTIRVKITGRESGRSFEASQTIRIGESGSDTDDGSSGEDDSLQAHSSGASAVKRSASPEPVTLEVDAGRDRLVSIGVPIRFEGKTLKPKTIKEGKVSFSWSFGDGAKTVGRAAEHTYLFPGEYTVVLNASYLGEEAVSRVLVKVIEPALSLVYVGDDYIEIANSSRFEENLGGWAIETDKGTFAISRDTIILAGKSLKIPSVVSGIVGASTFKLKNPSGQVVAEAEGGIVAGDFEVVIFGVDFETLERRLRDILGGGSQGGSSAAVTGGRETLPVAAAGESHSFASSKETRDSASLLLFEYLNI